MFRQGRWKRTAAAICALSERLQSAADSDLNRKLTELRWQAKCGAPLRSLIGRTFALVREASRRTLGLEHFPVQLIGGMALCEGHIAQMQTGEGKTLTATLAATLRALPGRGCHVVTVNDYLAGRDAALMAPVYSLLGLSVGCVLSHSSPDERREAYSRDITYATAKELGFDFLRDRLRMGASASPHQSAERRAFLGEERPVQRELYFALVDEADSVLIDEARTPLIIGLPQPNAPARIALFRWCVRAVETLREHVDYLYEPKFRRSSLTEAGCRRVLLLAKPSLMDSLTSHEISEAIENALTAKIAFQRDRDYVVHGDDVVIVDESTGRMMPGREWQNGLHQAIQARERLPLTATTAQAATVTVQRFFRQYAHLSGMTGTASSARREFKSVYRLRVSEIPTNRPCIRTHRPPRVFVCMESKLQAVADEVEQMRDFGRAVLIGTPSIQASEALGTVLTTREIPHTILNARHHAQEAEIVAQAGAPRAVTIATNMAGRGTDIHLHPEVRSAGGLHVLATEMHSSQRIDRQLVGRAARQGDPGSFQFFLSLEDELMHVLPAERLAALRKQAAAVCKGGELPARWVSLFRRAQRLSEKRQWTQRRQLARYERSRQSSARSMGLDPFLELTDA